MLANLMLCDVIREYSDGMPSFLVVAGCSVTSAATDA